MARACCRHAAAPGRLCAVLTVLLLLCACWWCVCSDRVAAAAALPPGWLCGVACRFLLLSVVPCTHSGRGRRQRRHPRRRRRVQAADAAPRQQRLGLGRRRCRLVKTSLALSSLALLSLVFSLAPCPPLPCPRCLEAMSGGSKAGRQLVASAPFSTRRGWCCRVLV